MRTKKEFLVIANFKMSFNMRYELQHWFANFTKAKKTLRLKRTTLVLCPPFVHLGSFAKKIKSKQIAFGAQDCFWEQKGAFTGMTSGTVLKSLGSEFVILGHSERRRFGGETNIIINKKIHAALKAGLRPIVCLGENAKEKQADMMLQVITKQFKECLSGVSPGKIGKVVFCYEPVWAISANKPDHLPTTNEIMGARLLIKRLLTQSYSATTVERAQVLYGGSVAVKNVQEICKDSGVDGVLVGSVSLMPYEIVKIAQLIDE